MAIRELDKIPTKALMARITAELEGLIVTDADGRYIYVNHRWSSLTGYTLDQVKGRYVRDIVRNSRVDEVLKSQKFVSGDAVLLNICTNEEVPVYCSYTPLFHDGEIEGCFVYMIPKSEHTSMTIPPNVVTLMEALNQQLLMVQSHSTAVNPLDHIIGASPEILKMKHEIVCAARSSSTVHIEGETGSGKELVAHAIHELSPRQNHRLVKVNCAAIPLELLESEFFGYVDGAFTGARRSGQVGKFEIANGGSLFLDEISQMPLTLQPKLLRVLQEREIERIGSSTIIPIDTRIISATNVPLSNIYFTIAQNNAERKYFVSVFLMYVSRANRSHFGSNLCFLPPFARRIFRCFHPALPAPILFRVKSGSGTGGLQFFWHGAPNFSGVMEWLMLL